MSQAAEKLTDTAQRPRITPYALIGGEAGLRRIVARFYEIMETDPAAARIRALHGPDVAPVREKLFEFLSGWLGGPPLYHRRADRKCIVSAHSSFAIGEAERDQWLSCMHRALEEAEVPEGLRAYLEEPLFRLADFIRNR
jgi:hemoglobin